VARTGKRRKKEKKKGRKKRYKEGKSQPQKYHIQGTLDTVKVILLVPGILCPSGQDNGNLLGYLRNPDDQLRQPPPPLLCPLQNRQWSGTRWPPNAAPAALQDAESEGS
jgi:hypothetical protein